MPVEDVTVEWPEALSPFVTVAKLRIPRQDISGDDNLEKMDALSFTPWRVTAEHAPLGNIMRRTEGGLPAFFCPAPQAQPAGAHGAPTRCLPSRARPPALVVTLLRVGRGGAGALIEERQVRTRLAAGGSRIRIVGPAEDARRPRRCRFTFAPSTSRCGKSAAAKCGGLEILVMSRWGPGDAMGRAARKWQFVAASNRWSARCPSRQLTRLLERNHKDRVQLNGVGATPS
jgi:hypothetical protein